MYFTNPIDICSTPEPQLVVFSVWPIMNGGTPKIRAMSSTWNRRCSISCESAAVIVIGATFSPPDSTIGLNAFVAPPWRSAIWLRRLSICPASRFFSVCSA